jgi:hypothetical protein
MTPGAGAWRPRIALVLIASVGATYLLAAQTQRPLPDRDAFFTATQANLQRAQREQWRYTYKERRTELHTNPFGRIGTGGVGVYEITPGPDASVFFRRLLEKDGQKVNDARPERQERKDRPQARTGVEDVVDTLLFTMDRREMRDGRETIVVTFTPRPDARPQTREGKIAKAVKGTIWVDEAAKEVVHVEAMAIDSMSYGFGLIARLNEGTKVMLTREPVGADVWLPTAVRFTGEGRAVLFRRLNVDYAVDWFDYRRVR